jgi:hypothetical protein
VLHYIFQEIIKYKSSNLSWSSASNTKGEAGPGRRDSNASNEATQNGATDNSHSDIPQT